ncbi:hypothetical protein HanHA300_Chr00c0237g0731601 [Helianthus annuus]|nr:hypothetical protein HanHA89_Chr12g0460331 [Helianthus annuus]KAJ0630479.1 hypothetical protein HanHA300_Chr00c0237g0731601 [Helianthus annuus]
MVNATATGGDAVAKGDHALSLDDQKIPQVSLEGLNIYDHSALFPTLVSTSFVPQQQYGLESKHRDNGYLTPSLTEKTIVALKDMVGYWQGFSICGSNETAGMNDNYGDEFVSKICNVEGDGTTVVIGGLTASGGAISQTHSKM